MYAINCTHSRTSRRVVCIHHDLKRTERHYYIHPRSACALGRLQRFDTRGWMLVVCVYHDLLCCGRGKNKSEI